MDSSILNEPSVHWYLGWGFLWVIHKFHICRNSPPLNKASPVRHLKGSNSSPQLFLQSWSLSMWGGQERPKESNSCSRTLLRTHPGPRVLCCPTAGSSWGEFGFNLQVTEIAILELILPVWEWKAAPIDKTDFHLTTWGRRQFRGAEGPWSLERVSAPASWVAGRLGGRELVMKRVNEEGN